MGLLKTFKNIVTGSSDHEVVDISSNMNDCTVYSKLTKAEYKLASMIYYKGHTSYRSFYRLVFFRNASKIEKIMNAATKKAEQGCMIESTFVRFMYDDRKFFEIPFDVFANKKNMRRSIRKTKEWDKLNIRRLISMDPKLRKLDDKLIRETIKEVIISNLN